MVLSLLFLLAIVVPTISYNEPNIGYGGQIVGHLNFIVLHIDTREKKCIIIKQLAVELTRRLLRQCRKARAKH